jgi:hypothetical protein
VTLQLPHAGRTAAARLRPHYACTPQTLAPNWLWGNSWKGQAAVTQLRIPFQANADGQVLTTVRQQTKRLHSSVINCWRRATSNATWPRRPPSAPRSSIAWMHMVTTRTAPESKNSGLACACINHSGRLISEMSCESAPGGPAKVLMRHARPAKGTGLAHRACGLEELGRFSTGERGRARQTCWRCTTALKPSSHPRQGCERGQETPNRAGVVTAAAHKPRTHNPAWL